MAGKTLKEEVEAADKKLLDYCALVEKEMEPLAEIVYCDQRKGEIDTIGLGTALQAMVQRTKNLAWAIQRFPSVDMSIFHQIERKKIVWAREPDREMELWLPKWAVGYYPGTEAGIAYMNMTRQELDFFAPAGYTGRMPQQAHDENLRIMDTRFVTVTSPVPPAPLNIRRAVEPFLFRFDWVCIMAEANWQSSALKDPLVVGIIDAKHRNGPMGNLTERYGFILGEYDPSKLEKYVLAEFAVKPKA